MPDTLPTPREGEKTAAVEQVDDDRHIAEELLDFHSQLSSQQAGVAQSRRATATEMTAPRRPDQNDSRHTNSCKDP